MTGDDIEPPKLDFSNPYYLGSHDIPGAKISHVTLRRDNYDDWRNSIRMSLKSRRKFGFVDGSIKNPTTKFDLDNWEVVHCTIIQWIRNTIDPSLLHAISYAEDASVLWAELEAQFYVVDGSKIHGLKTQLRDCRQGKGLALRDQERGERSRFYCNFCETHGHTINNCYIKSQNFPDWWGDRPRSLADLRHARRKARGSARGSGSGTAGSGSGQGSGSAGSAGSSDGTSSGVNPSMQAHLVSYTKTTIGVGELRDGLYWISAHAKDEVVNSVSTGSASLWHQRLDHPSNKAFKAISFTNSLHFSKPFVCETCHFAKQHRNSFTLNDKHASAMFELIHCDLLGPYRIVSSCGAKYFRTIVDDFSRATWNTRGDKFEKRGRKCIFVGYPHNKKGWKLYDVETGSYFVSRDVVFHEDVFPYTALTASSRDDELAFDTPFNGTVDDTGSGARGVLLVRGAHGTGRVLGPRHD
ncbi:uncharacterized protein LOC141655061 [Silene latifolia]|uniref:uncharacterized protein LOC141655061 n=1 Tax=Silene latifolia TaxID=37657 RepID=UPI003D783C5B